MGGFINTGCDLKLLQDKNITSTAKLVYLVLLGIDFNCTGEIIITNNGLLQIFGYSIDERTLQRALVMLDKHRYIKREIITEPGHQNERMITILK